MQQVKICNDNGCTKVDVITLGGDGTPDEVVSCSTVEAGQEVLLTVSTEGNVEAGDVTATVTDTDEEASEESDETTEESQGDE